MCALNQLDHTWMKSSGIKLYTVWCRRGTIHACVCSFTGTASPHGIPTAAGPEEAPALSSVRVQGEIDNVPTDIPYLFFYLNNKISIFRKSTCPKNTCFCVLPLFKYTCENLSLLRETVLLSSVCKYRLSASTLRSKRGDRFTSVPLCNYSSLAGSDLIYQGRSTCGSILSRIILKNSHQLNFTAEKTIRT